MIWARRFVLIVLAATATLRTAGAASLSELLEEAARNNPDIATASLRALADGNSGSIPGFYAARSASNTSACRGRKPAPVRRIQQQRIRALKASRNIPGHSLSRQIEPQSEKPRNGTRQ